MAMQSDAALVVGGHVALYLAMTVDKWCTFCSEGVHYIVVGCQVLLKCSSRCLITVATGAIPMNL